MASDKVQKKMARGALWMILLTFVDRTIALISTLILVRVLSPADFANNDQFEPGSAARMVERPGRAGHTPAGGRDYTPAAIK